MAIGMPPWQRNEHIPRLDPPRINGHPADRSDRSGPLQIALQQSCQGRRIGIGTGGLGH